MIAYEMFTGRPPFDADSVLSIMYKHAHEVLRDPRKYRPDLSPRLSAVILRCLAKARADRFRSADEISGMLMEVDQLAA